MPRLLAGGPGLGLSPRVKGRAYLAVAGSGRLTIFDADSREEVAAAHLQGEAIDVAFALTADELRVVTFAAHESATDARSFTVPGLAPAGQIELIGPVKPAACAGDRLLVCSEAGERPRILTVAPRLFAVDPIALPEPLQAVAVTAAEQLVVVAHDHVELWDPLLRRLAARINLPVAKARQAGFASRRRFLWIASASGIDVFRFSDGRLQLHIDLGQRFLTADGHPESGRLVAAARAGDGPIELEVFELGQPERHKLPAAQVGAAPASFCVIEGARPMVALADSDARLRFVPLLSELATEAAHARPRHATPPVAVRAGKVALPLDAPGGWRSRLGRGEEVEKAEREAARDPRLPTVRVEAAGDEPHAPLAAARAEVEVDRIEAAEPESAGWRKRIADWGKAVLDGEEPAPLPDPRGSPLAELGARFSLGPHARAVLALLYAARLLGHGKGLAVATLGRVDGPEWTEALGAGELFDAELVRTRRGRLKLRGQAARFLDGRRPAAEPDDDEEEEEA